MQKAGDSNLLNRESSLSGGARSCAPLSINGFRPTRNRAALIIKVNNGRVMPGIGGLPLEAGR
jgi:hypothetical protein